MEELERDLDNASAWHLLGIAALEFGRNAPAFEFIDNAVRLDPSNPVILADLGKAARALGRLDQAESLCRQALRMESDCAEAHNTLGNVLRDNGRIGEAEASYRQALVCKPDYPQAHCNLGNVLRDSGRLTAAETSYLHALACKPDFAVAHNNLGLLLRDLGRLEEAIHCHRRAIEFKPDYGLAYFNLANALSELGRYQDAEQSYRRVLDYMPAYAEAHNNLGNLLKDIGRIQEAEERYRQAVRCKPAFAQAYYNLAAVLADRGAYLEAEESYRRALTCMPSFAEAHNNLGNLFRLLDRLEAAEECYRNALLHQPGYFEAVFNLGLVMSGLGRIEEAEEYLRDALSLRPDYAPAHNSLGNVLGKLGRSEEAAECYALALKYEPDHVEALSGWLHRCQSLCNWSGMEQCISTLREEITRKRRGRVQPFSFLALPGTTAFEQRDCAFQVASRLYATFLARPPACQPFIGRGERQHIRIGFLSADFHNHATSFLLAEVIELLDRERFEVLAYSHGPDDDSAMRKRMRAAFDVFHDIRSLSNESAAQRIHDDEIDILVDLKGYTNDSRLEICALRPAPVIVNWLGYPGTLGHPRMADYLIGDPIVTPLDHAGRYSETLALVPDCYQPNDRQRKIGPLPTRAEAGLPEEGFVFCSFNQVYKITPDRFDLWCRLLEVVPGSVLWLLRPNSTAENNLREEARARGIAPERLIFAPKLPLSEHLGRLQLADLALDTFPVTSHTTASDALWAGVPLVTQIGETFVSRVAASILHAAGLTELVVETPEAYFQLVLALARDNERLENLRNRLNAIRLTCPLFDSERFTRNLEKILQSIRDHSLAGIKEPIKLET